MTVLSSASIVTSIRNKISPKAKTNLSSTLVSLITLRNKFRVRRPTHPQIAVQQKRHVVRGRGHHPVVGDSPVVGERVAKRHFISALSLG